MPTSQGEEIWLWAGCPAAEQLQTMNSCPCGGQDTWSQSECALPPKFPALLGKGNPVVWEAENKSGRKGGKSALKRAPASISPTGSLSGQGPSCTLNTPRGPLQVRALWAKDCCMPKKTKFASRIFFRHFARCTASLTIFNVLTAWSSELINWCWRDQ